MVDRSLGTGFRLSRVLAWGPALILVVSLLFVIRGDMPLALLLAGAAIVFWLIVRRRKSQAAP